MPAAASNKRVKNTRISRPFSKTPLLFPTLTLTLKLTNQPQ
jgi:hypothetical protein